MRMRIAYIVVVAALPFIVGVSFTLFVPKALGADCPNAGERPATEADVPLMLAAGFPASYAKVGNCWPPSDTNVGQGAGEAKQYLRSILCANSSFGGAGPDGTIQRLDGKFAVCAAKFLKAASSQIQANVPLLNGGANPVCLREGFRAVAQQEKYANEYKDCLARGGGNKCPIACVRGGACEHPRGIAIDVNTSDANYQKLWAIGAQFGVNFYLRSRDPVHFVPSSGDCSGGGTVAPGGTLPPSNLDYPQYYTPPISTPSNSFSNSLRGLLGMPQQPPVLSQQPFQYSQPTQIGTPASNPTTQTTNPVSSSINTNTNSNANSTQTASSAAELLAALGNPVGTAVTIATSVSIMLNTNLNSAVDASGNQTQSGNVFNTSYVPLQPTLAVQQTFVSNDLSNSPQASAYVPGQTSTMQSILLNLRTVLINILNYLRPFGAKTQPAQIQYVMD